MRVFLKSTKRGIDAQGDYNIDTRSLVVLKGSIVSAHISEAATFRGAKTVKKYRNQYVLNQVVQADVIFKSSSSAANFVTGSSTDGTKAWKTSEGLSISALNKKEEG